MIVMHAAGMAQPVPEQIDFPREEEKILQLWKELNAFQTSLLQSKNRPRSENCSIMFGIIYFEYFMDITCDVALVMLHLAVSLILGFRLKQN